MTPSGQSRSKFSRDMNEPGGEVSGATVGMSQSTDKISNRRQFCPYMAAAVDTSGGLLYRITLGLPITVPFKAPFIYFFWLFF
jgi:hypothetical protein